MRLALNYYRVDPSKGGAETYVRDLCHRLVQAGHEVDLYAHECSEGALPAEVRHVKVEASGWTRWGRTWRFAINSEAALRRESYDCTVGFINTWHHDVLIPQGGVHGASLDHNARRFPAGWRRQLYRLAKQANPKSAVYRAIERKQYDPARSVRIVAVSAMVQGHLERYHHVPRSRVCVIPNAIDADRLLLADPGAARRDFRHGLGLGPDDLVALFLGHNFWLKGLEPLLLALQYRRHRRPSGRPIHLLVCGGGRLGPCRRMVKRLGLGDTVHLVGFVPQIRQVFWASDFFAMPTYYDPCSLVVFEALACGLPVITTACNGAAEVITEGREGFIIQTPDARAHLADALDRMTDDTGRRTMSAHAARLGREQSFENHMARLLALFEEVSASKANRAPHALKAGSRTLVP
jgi:UDP-glucose:(heptosyl)LPS alpha-1,3-glucosyltransferase